MKKKPRKKITFNSLTIDGETKTVKEWAAISGVPSKRIANRLYDGWEIKEAVFSELLQQGIRRKNKVRVRKIMALSVAWNLVAEYPLSDLSIGSKYER